jgi:DNA-binding HxlR family transcriptional regulator
MKGKKTDLGSSACAIARSLGVVGDWWSLLLVRDALSGARRFGEFESKLGLAKNILASRLRKLIEEGIFERVPSSDGGAHDEYQLTKKGEELYVVLVGLWQWGEKHTASPKDRRLIMVDRQTQQKIARLEVRAKDGRRVGPRDYTSRVIGTGS